MEAVEERLSLLVLALERNRMGEVLRVAGLRKTQRELRRARAELLEVEIRSPVEQ